MTGFIVLARCNSDDVICGLYETVESAFVRAKEIANDPKLRHTCQPLSSDTEMLSVCVLRVSGDHARFVRECWLDELETPEDVFA